MLHEYVCNYSIDVYTHDCTIIICVRGFSGNVWYPSLCYIVLIIINTLYIFYRREMDYLDTGPLVLIHAGYQRKMIQWIVSLHISITG